MRARPRAKHPARRQDLGRILCPALRSGRASAGPSGPLPTRDSRLATRNSPLETRNSQPPPPHPTPPYLASPYGARPYRPYRRTVPVSASYTTATAMLPALPVSPVPARSATVVAPRCPGRTRRSISSRTSAIKLSIVCPPYLASSPPASPRLRGQGGDSARSRTQEWVRDWCSPPPPTSPSPTSPPPAGDCAPPGAPGPRSGTAVRRLRSAPPPAPPVPGRSASPAPAA